MAEPTEHDVHFTVPWTEMQHGTREHYAHHRGVRRPARGALVDNLINMLGLLKGPTLGYQVDRYSHSLQSGTRAYRNGESVDMVVAALLHDIADSFAPENHSDAAAALLRPYVDNETHWVVKHHGLFQGYYYFHHHEVIATPTCTRTRRSYDRCVDFCHQYDQNCFDPNYPVMDVEDFRPMLRCSAVRRAFPASPHCRGSGVRRSTFVGGRLQGGGEQGVDGAELGGGSPVASSMPASLAATSVSRRREPRSSNQRLKRTVKPEPASPLRGGAAWSVPSPPSAHRPPSTGSWSALLHADAPRSAPTAGVSRFGRPGRPQRDDPLGAARHGAAAGLRVTFTRSPWARCPPLHGQAPRGDRACRPNLCCRRL